MSVLTLPEPDGWRGSRKLLAWLTFGTLIVFLPAIVWGIVVLFRGEYVTTVVMFGVAAFPLTTVVSLWLVELGRTKLSAGDGPTGTRLLPDRAYTALFYAGSIGMIIGGLLFVIYVPRGEVALPMSRGWQIFSPFLIGAAVVVALVGLVSVWRRGGVGYVELTRSGLDIANIVSTKSFAWDDITNVKDRAESRRTRKAVVLGLRDGTDEVIDGADVYVPRGTALYWMVRHYWRQPDQRAELTDGRAVQRLREGRFELD